MSAENSIVRDSIVQDGRASEVSSKPAGFELPPALALRYEVRVVDGADGEQRIGLFRPTDRDGPSIEISNERIVARSEDAETVAALVTIAKHSGWDRIVVDGSPEFRRAIWEAASREGLAVKGYEPSFAELERVEQARRDVSDRRERHDEEQGSHDSRDRATKASPPGDAVPVMLSPGREDTLEGDGNALSDDDRRLLLTLSQHTVDRKALAESMHPAMDDFGREVQHQRLESNREALNAALDRVLESSTLVKAFERSGYEPQTLRALGRGDQWDGEIAEAIYLTRSGLHRDAQRRTSDDLAVGVGEIEADRRDRASGEPAVTARDEPVDRGSWPAEAPIEPRREDEQLAEFFLHGASEHVAEDARLVGARQAQAAMELHIGEVFGGDADRIASATLESRQMISDVLRQGLDVSVREPTPVRQIEPAQIPPDMER